MSRWLEIHICAFLRCWISRWLQIYNCCIFKPIIKYLFRPAVLCVLCVHMRGLCVSVLLVCSAGVVQPVSSRSRRGAAAVRRGRGDASEAVNGAATARRSCRYARPLPHGLTSPLPFSLWFSRVGTFISVCLVDFQHWSSYKGFFLWWHSDEAAYVTYKYKSHQFFITLKGIGSMFPL